MEPALPRHSGRLPEPPVPAACAPPLPTRPKVSWCAACGALDLQIKTQIWVAQSCETQGRCEAALRGWTLEFELPADICTADWRRALTAAWPATVGDAQQQTAQADSHLHPHW